MSTRISQRGRLRAATAAVAFILVLGLALPALADAGDLDPTFGDAGKVVTNDIQGWARAIAIQADGKIVIAGTDDMFGDDARFALARYNTDGTLDTTY